ncbi:MAG TPA: 3-methyl-2-oxobutanoate hydroxymethyltransferase [Chloroflexota bacterium]|jgi:3-methyl-2-oxobutanoate hydroxymethyltransferase
MAKLTVADLQQMKRDGKKIAAAICYDYQMARIMDAAGMDLLTVGDSVGRNFWGQETHMEITVDQQIIACLAVTRGAERAVVNCDMPFGPLQEGAEPAVRAAIRLVKEGHAEVVKVDNAPANLEAVKRIAAAGIPVWTQFGFSPQSSLGSAAFDTATAETAKQYKEKILQDARELEEAGASMLDLTHVPDHNIYAEVVRTSKIPVLGGSSAAGPEADGRISGFTYRFEQINGGGPGHGGEVAQLLMKLGKEYVENVRAAKQKV